jgi:gliding motility-associated-like protein
MMLRSLKKLFVFKRLQFVLMVLPLTCFGQSFNEHSGHNISALYNGQLLAIDINADGWMDVVQTGTDDYQSYFKVYLNNRNFNFSPLTPINFFLSNIYTSWCDINNDGYIDFAVSGINDSGSRVTYIGFNNGDSTFIIKDYKLEGTVLGESLWADFDNDGKRDLFLYGINNAGNRVSILYQQKNESFIEINRLIGFSSGKAVIFDYNNDGKKDIFITGLDQNIVKKSYLYQNNGDFNFTAKNTGIDAITSGDIVTADVDGDGWPDLIITGSNQNNKRICKLYLNRQGSFIEKANTFTDSLSNSHVSVSDINNDGKPDVIFTGTDNRLFYQTVMYLNLGNGNFERNTSLSLPVTSAAILNTDLNNDNKPDLIISGKTYSENICKVFENTITVSNSSPDIPDGTGALPYRRDSVLLYWNNVLDKEQGSNDIQYNVFVGNSKNSVNIVSPQSILLSGKRLTQQAGNALTKNQLTIKNLPENKYFWAVQAIDNNHNASAFSSLDSFTICNPVFAGNDTTICKGDTAILKVAPASMTSNWYSLKNGLIASGTFICKFAPQTTDTVVLECHNYLGCTLYDTLIVKVLSPLPIILPSDTAGCSGSSIRLSIGNYFKEAFWRTSNIGFIHNDSLAYWHKIMSVDTVWVTAIDTNNCQNQSSVIVNKYDLPQWSIGKDRHICKYDSVHLQINDNFSSIHWYSYDRTKLKSSTPEYNSKIIENDSLLIVVTDSNRCSTTDTLIIYMLPLPPVNIGNDTSVCYKDTLLIMPDRVTGRTDWISSNSGILASDTIRLFYQVMTPDNIVAMVTDSNNCRNTDTLRISVLPLPEFTVGNDTAVCYGQNLMLSVGAGWKRVDWYTKIDGLWKEDQWFVVRHETNTDTIWVKVQNQYKCKAFDTIHIVVYPLPVVFAGNDTSICFKDTLLLKSNNNFPYIQWNSSTKGWLSNDNIYPYEVNVSDTIVLTAVDQNNCKNTDTTLINVIPLPEIPAVNDTSACNKDTIKFNIPGIWKKLFWQSFNHPEISSDSALFLYPVENNDTLLIKATNLMGCRSEKTMIINAHRLPKIEINDTSICRNECIKLQLLDTLIQKVKWNMPDNKITETNNLMMEYCPEVNGKVTVTAYTNNNCSVTDTINVEIYELPVVNIGKDTTVCYGSSIILGQDNMIIDKAEIKKISWQNVESSQSSILRPSVELTQDTLYTLIVSDIHGCSAQDSINIEVNPPSQFTLPDTVAICFGQTAYIGQSYIINGSRFKYSFEWWPDTAISNITAELPEFNPLSTTRYRVVAHTWLCKPDTDYLVVLVRPLPIIYHTPDITIGENGYVQLYAEGGSSYRWWPANSLNQPDIPDPIARPEKSTTYSIMATDNYGCVSYDSLTVYVGNQIFVPDLFSPNQDGKNDTFKIYGFGILNLTLTISNLQNVILYESSDIQKIMEEGWDGTYKGNAVPEGQYRWHLKGKFIDGQDILYKGKSTGILLLIR